MEFGYELESEGLFVPRGMANQGTGPAKNPGKEWKSDYAVIGMAALNQDFVVDGINEKGLVGGILYFPGFAEYTSPDEADASKAVAPWEFLTWALGTCSSVEEIKAKIDEVQVIGLKVPGPNFIPPFHYTFHDAEGKSIVIEPTGGELKVFDNPFGVMTNSPTFDWHLTNMRNYVKLSPENVDSFTVKGTKVDSFGQGSGWLGIPGDPTPPSRFIRALAFSMTPEPEPSGIKSVRLAEHVMNNFDIPYGSIRPAGKPKKGEFDYTQWTAIVDIENRLYYIKTYNNQMLQSISFDDFDLEGEVAVKAPIADDLSVSKLEFPN
tara:strand:+ start:6935 stop:7897 length:963 start_codon:yes stop_codon:yes gene_type:complete